MEIVIHIAAALLLIAVLYKGFKFLKARNEAREAGSGGNPPGGNRDAQ